ncbi:MAG: iron-containing alcohol dehydrogenase [Olegusella sp.]|nr:iron-containing alcohol dehydrogenase [Olegusella sp.]
MRDFQWISPTEFVFGHAAEERIGAWASEHGFARALVVYGQGHVERSGLLARVLASLDASGIEHVEMGGVRPNPEVTSVRRGIELAREHGVDLIVPVGGDSTIDCSKAIAGGTLYDGDVWDFYQKPNPRAIKRAIPLAVVLTIPAAGSEGSNSSVISNDELGLKSGLHSDLVRPRVAFMDPELTLTLPAWQTFSGITDMCAHIMERFFSASEDVPVTDEIALGLLRSIRACALRLLRDPSDYDARANIMWASTLAHNGLAGRGREEDWASHALEHELSALHTDVTHGAGLAVMFPAWMRYVCDARPERFVRFGRELFGIVPTGDDLADAHAAIDRLQEFFVSMGMPRTLADLGFVPEDVEKMLPTLRQNKGEAFGSFKKLSIDDARQIYLSAF